MVCLRSVNKVDIGASAVLEHLGERERPGNRLKLADRNLNQGSLAAESARKAYELREKISERERFDIEALYYLGVTGELEKAAQSYELWQQTYPRDPAAYVNLGVISGQLGN